MLSPLNSYVVPNGCIPPKYFHYRLLQDIGMKHSLKVVGRVMLSYQADTIKIQIMPVSGAWE